MLEHNQYIVKEKVKLLSYSDTFDILSPETGEKMGQAQEVVGGLIQVARFFMNKRNLPTTIEVRESPDDSLVFTIQRGFNLFKANVQVLDAQGELVGYFRSKFLTISGGFTVYTPDDKPFAEVKGKLFGFNYRFVRPDEHELGTVSKKFEGALKELFTTADKYLVEIDPELSGQPMAKMLLLAAALAIDIVYKDQS